MGATEGRRRRRTLVVSGSAALLALVLSGCGEDAEVQISEVYGGADSAVLEVGVTSCNGEPTVRAEETAAQVRLEVDADTGSGNDCADAAMVTLSEPLGEREVVDAATDEVIELLPADG